MSAQLKGPKIQRDIALLIRLLWRIEGWEDPTSRSCMASTTAFVELIGGYKSCPCSSCNSIVDSSKTTAAILEPHIRALIQSGGEKTSDFWAIDPKGDRQQLTSTAIEAAVYNMMEKYLLTCEKVDDGEPAP